MTTAWLFVGTIEEFGLFEENRVQDVAVFMSFLYRLPMNRSGSIE
jgi:hypothetical protein